MRFLPWAAAILSVFNDLVGQGYRLNSVGGYECNSQPNFAFIFEKESSVAWISHHSMTSANYQIKFDLYVSQGYRVIQVNGYTVGENAYYAAIWDKSPSAGWVTHHGMTAELMQKYFDEYLKQGYKLTRISGYELNGEACSAAIWEKKNDNIAWLSYANMTSDEYQSRFDKYVKDGYRLIDVDGRPEYHSNNI